MLMFPLARWYNYQTSSSCVPTIMIMANHNYFNDLAFSGNYLFPAHRHDINSIHDHDNNSILIEIVSSMKE